MIYDLSDIQCGEESRKLCDNHMLGKDDWSLLWNCDVVPVFKGSKYQICPIQYSARLLIVDRRKQHILMPSLWFWPSKPNMMTLLTPFTNEPFNLETTGIDWEDRQGNTHLSKVFVLVCSSDSVARPMLRNTKQFNGVYGCDFCFHDGGKYTLYCRTPSKCGK